MKKKDPSYLKITVSRNNLAVAKTLKHRITVWPRNSIPIHSSELETCQHKYKKYKELYRNKLNAH